LVSSSFASLRRIVLERLSNSTLSFRVFLTGSFILIVVLPIVITAYRSSEYAVSTQTSPMNVRGRPPFDMSLAYVNRLLRTPATLPYYHYPLLQPSIIDRVSLRLKANSVVVTARADTPSHAFSYANEVKRQLASASSRVMYARAKKQLKRIENQLRRPNLTRKDKRQLRMSRSEVNRILARMPYALVFTPFPASARSLNPIDRFVDRLPGPKPPKPSIEGVTFISLILYVMLFFFAVCGFGRGCDRTNEKERSLVP
jgi:hypothetical protein